MAYVVPRAFTIACATIFAFASVAAADPAPIVFAGQGAGALAGGDARSYGYGATNPHANAPVIDLRGASGRVQPVAQTVTQPIAQTPAPQAATSPARPAWLEQERAGPPYQANGRWYVPTAEPGYEATGTASWYGPTFHGQRTASGEVFDQEAITAAHPTLPIPCLVQVTNLENGREVIVRVNDRGPFVGDRVLDLSHGAAQVLGVERNGTAHVHIRYLGPAPRHVDTAQPMQSAAAPQMAPAVAAPEQAGPASLLPPATAPREAAAPQAAAVQPASYQPPAPPAGSFMVQVGAFSDVTNAHRVQSALTSVGSVAVDVRRTAAGGELFRVRIGPFASRAEAETARQAAIDLGYAESVLAAP